MRKTLTVKKKEFSDFDSSRALHRQADLFFVQGSTIFNCFLWWYLHRLKLDNWVKVIIIKQIWIENFVDVYTGFFLYEILNIHTTFST